MQQFIIKTLAFVILITCFRIYAQQPDFQFQHLTSAHGLSQNTVNAIEQDKFGFICVNAAGNFLTPFIMNPVNDSVLLVGKAQVWRSTNRGVSFTQVSDAVGTSNFVALA